MERERSGGGGGSAERGEERREWRGNNADHNNTPVNHNSGWAGIMISADFIMIAVKFGNLAFSIKASKRRMGTMEAKVTQDHDQIMILVGLSGSVQFPKIPERREGGVDKRKEKEDRGKEERRVERAAARVSEHSLWPTNQFL